MSKSTFFLFATAYVIALRSLLWLADSLNFYCLLFFYVLLREKKNGFVEVSKS